MNREFIEQLNRTIDRVIDEKKTMNLNYDLLEKTLGLMLRSNINARYSPIQTITPLKKEEILKITLDFFKFIDIEFYNKARDVILQKNKNIKMNVYDINNIKDFSQRDENGLLQYTPEGNVESYNGNTKVNIPTRRAFNYKGEDIEDNNACTLNDLYTIVHEISHLFDLDMDFGKLLR